MCQTCDFLASQNVYSTADCPPQGRCGLAPTSDGLCLHLLYVCVCNVCFN